VDGSGSGDGGGNGGGSGELSTASARQFAYDERAAGDGVVQAVGEDAAARWETAMIGLGTADGRTREVMQEQSAPPSPQAEELAARLQLSPGRRAGRQRAPPSSPRTVLVHQVRRARA
jgi:hypothetical protein